VYLLLSATTTAAATNSASITVTTTTAIAIADASASVSAVTTASAITVRLKLLRQDMPCYKLQQHSKNAVESFGPALQKQNFKLARRFARYGSKAQCDPHAQRNVQRCVRPGLAIAPYFIKVPLLTRVRKLKRKLFVVEEHVSFTSIPIILPWEVLLFLQRVGRFDEVYRFIVLEHVH